MKGKKKPKNKKVADAASRNVVGPQVVDPIIVIFQKIQINEAFADRYIKELKHIYTKVKRTHC